MDEANLKKVLIVDDEIHIRDCGARTIKRRLKVQVTTIDNGIAAVESIRAVSYDLVLLDLSIPDLDGYGVIRKVREFNKDLKFIVITGHDVFTQEQQDLLNKETIEVMHKPLDIRQVVRKVVDILGADIAIDPICVDPEALKGRPEAREIIHTLKNLHGNLRIRCDEYFCAYEHGFYKDYTAEEHIAMLHSILNDVKATVKLAQVSVEEIRKL